MESSVHPSMDFFLGATTPAGFKGYFAPLRREPGMQLVLLKSGPGCGKSTLMKRLARAAQEKGEPIPRIHCASDPDSLDGVVFLRQKRAIIDATAPHVVEPEAPGADERVLSLYHTIDADALHPHKDEVTALFARNQLLRSRAARYVASAGSLLLDSRRAEACSANFEKVRRYVKRLCTRLLPRTEEMGSEELRLLSAITPKGEVFYQGTVQALADRCILFRDDYGAVSRLLLELIRAEALGLPHHHLPLRHAPGGQDRPHYHPLPAAGISDRQPLASGAAVCGADRAVQPFCGQGEPFRLPRTAALQRARRRRAAGTGLCPDGAGKKLPRRTGDLLPHRRGLCTGGCRSRPVHGTVRGRIT